MDNPIMRAGVALATALAIVGVAIVPFLNTAYVGFEQSRTGVLALTGYSAEELRAIDERVLSDLVFGPPSFDVAVRSVPVFNDRERGHLADVRGVFVNLGAAVAIAIVILAAANVASRGSPSFWRAAALGAKGLGWAVVIVGAVALVAFEPAFEVFHSLFFAGGTYTFDPSSERLVQLFPESFWFETAIVVGVVILALAIALAAFARRRAGVAVAGAAQRLEPQASR